MLRIAYLSLAVLLAAAWALPGQAAQVPPIFIGPDQAQAQAAADARAADVQWALAADSGASFAAPGGNDGALLAADTTPPTTDQTQPAAATQAAETAPWSKGPPLPFHTIEGYGGGAITPIAYLVNPPAPDHFFGLPAAAFSYVNLGSKNLEAFTITENLGGRVELGYGADHFDFGTLRSDVKTATGGAVDIGHNDEWLHNFNVRVLALKEGSFDLPLPAFTLGAHLKYNDTINDVNNRLGGALRGLGYNRDWGVDFTQTFTKAFPHVFGRPLILTAGARESEAANLGFLGFSDEYKVGFEGNIVYLPTDWLVLAYEYRNKPRGYNGNIPGLIDQESDWHAFDASWIINKRATLVAGYGIFGNLANSKANSAWWLQIKYEF